MLVGLQGAGKTTAAAKLANLLRNQGERVMLVAADPYRPAAVTQLQTLAGKDRRDGLPRGEKEPAGTGRACRGRRQKRRHLRRDPGYGRPLAAG